MIPATKFAHAVRQMASERVHFYDGMILSANDLEAERDYHIARSRLINRAVFGCGIACGLEVEKHPADVPATRFVCVRPGIAFDCKGDPLELCRPVKLDLDPDPCKRPPTRVCILIRRRDAKPQSGNGDGCCEQSAERPSRIRDEVEIRVVDSLTSFDEVCWTPPETARHDAGDCADAKTDEPPEHDPCACLKECESCRDCGEDWILLACVDLRQPERTDYCPDHDRDRWVIEEIDHSGRRYIKPIRCHCPPQKPEKRKHPEDRPCDHEEPKHPGAPQDARGEVANDRSEDVARGAGSDARPRPS